MEERERKMRFYKSFSRSLKLDKWAWDEKNVIYAHLLYSYKVVIDASSCFICGTKLLPSGFVCVTTVIVTLPLQDRKIYFKWDI